jgi:polysaccharide biosynthesis transport protein
MERVFEGSPQTQPVGTALQPIEYLRLLRSHAHWWVVPAVAFALIAGAYSLVTSRQWKATQALVIRPEVASVSEERLGKFSDLSEMKTSQETILELAKSQTVIRGALREVGAPRGYRRAAEWPTALDVESFRDCVDMRPPGGAEFGKTEVFYLTVRDKNRDRASALVVALCGQLESRLQELRDQTARSMIAEMDRTVSMANDDLSGQITKLSVFEAKIGSDLAELRNLNADLGGQGEVSQERQAIEAERRANDSRLTENKRLLELLVAAQKDPQQLVATPNTLLVSQPAVGQLKNALVNAQLRTAELLSSRSENHPYVIAAHEAEASIRQQLNNEVAVAIRGLQVDIELCGDRETSLAEKWTAARTRMSRLAEARAEYASLVASVQNHTRLVEAARKNLADARACQASAHSASVISRIDSVDAGIRPAGPSRKTVSAAGGVGGLIFGFGLIFLFAKPSNGSIKSVEQVRTAKTVVTSPVANNPEIASEPSEVRRPATVSETFGMFRGMSLQEALSVIERRGTR